MTPHPSAIRLLLIFFLGLFIFLFFYVGIYSPKKQQLGELKESTSQLEKKLLILKKHIKKIRTEPHTKKEAPSETPAIRLEDLPFEDDTAELLSKWTQYGKRLGIEFILFKPGAERQLGRVIEMPIRLTLQGTFHQTLKFFDFLAGQKRKMIIANIKMKQPERKEGDYVISTHANVITFRRVSAGGSPGGSPGGSQ